MFADELSINLTSTNLEVGEGGTATFTATASGRKTRNFTYQWRKRGSNSLPDKASGSNGPILTIPNLLESDEGQYYCIVTNEWGRSVESDDTTLTVEGILLKFDNVASSSDFLYQFGKFSLIINEIFLMIQYFHRY